MKALKLSAVAALLFAAASFSGCANASFYVPPEAALFSSYKTPVEATTNEVGGKKGKTCKTTILGAYTLGLSDYSYMHAVKDAGINQIGTVSQSVTSILLGLYRNECYIVTGK